mgnify:FL=1
MFENLPDAPVADIRRVMSHVGRERVRVVDVIREARVATGWSDERVRAALMAAISEGSAGLHEDVTVSRVR